MVLQGLFHLHVTTPRPVAAGCPCRPSRTLKNPLASPLLTTTPVIPNLCPLTTPHRRTFPTRNPRKNQTLIESLSIQALQAFITSGFYLIYRVSEAMLIVQNGQDHVSMLYVRSS